MVLIIKHQVGVCGPAAMGRDMSKAVVDAIHPSAVLRGEHRRNVYLTEETFVSLP